MVDQKRPEGIYTAIVTPFDSSREIDWPAFDKLLHYQSRAKVSGIVVCGTTGESPTVTVQEELALIRKAKAELPSNIKVMAGVGGSNTDQSVELAKLVKDAGADSLLVVTPPYSKPTLKGLKAHYSAIAEATKHPICLYHVPARTGQFLSRHDFSALLECEQIVSVKEASSDLVLMGDLVANHPETNFLSGDDLTFLGALAYGSQGLVSVASNLAPQAIVKMHDLFKAGDQLGALVLQQALAPLFAIMFIESNPAPLKYCLARLGLIKESFRLPMVAVESASRDLLDQCLDDTNLRLQKLGVGFEV